MKINEPKQETIEDLVSKMKIIDSKVDLFSYSLGLKDGSKHQAERMFSEEDVIAFTQWMYDYKGDINKVKDLLKQFKQK